jgi:hypothetical protein
VIRQHASTLIWRLRGRRRRVGRIATGVVYEQAMQLDFEGATLSVRRITLRLDRPTESGDTELHILTNLSPEQATASQVARTYGTRWTVEGAFQTLTDVLRCEVALLYGDASSDRAPLTPALTPHVRSPASRGGS